MASGIRDERVVDMGRDARHERRRRRGIYLLPNLFTTAALFAGFFGIAAAKQGRWETASIAIFVAMVLDGLDGRVARMTNTQSDFGKEYDSLADMVSFGVAPALILHEWSLQHWASYGWGWPQLGWLAAFIYTVCAALRLARFNALSGNEDKRYFRGLSSPMAAAVVVSLVWAGADLDIPGRVLVIPAIILAVISGVLMVSNFRYRSFKDIDLAGRVPFYYLLLLVVAFIVLTVAVQNPFVMFLGVFAYALSGPAAKAWSRKAELLPDRLRGKAVGNGGD